MVAEAEQCGWLVSCSANAIASLGGAALPSPGPAAGIDQAGLASISRTLAWQRRPVRNGSRATAGPAMRNVELVLRDPR